MPVSSGSLDRRARHRIGAVLRGKYTLESVLGVGGMATVYLGVHRNGHRVAIKMLHPELSFDDAHRSRFVREGYVANAIEHKGAVRVLDDDIAEDGAAFLVMELLEGETLHARRKRLGGTLPHREVAALGHQLLDVLAAAHDKGVIHRDIKPENLFLTTEGVLKVLDFGIARFHDDAEVSATLTGRSIGTPAFMPPEQALGRKSEIDARTDVWACGATLFTLLSGRFVHMAETVEELVVRTATVDARPLAAVAPDVPPELAEVIDRALAFERADRWPSARAMREALDNAYVALTGEPLSSVVVRVDPADVAAKRGDGEATLDAVASGPTELARKDDDEIPLEAPALATRRDEVRSATTRVAGGAPAPAPEAPPPARSRARLALAGLFIALCIGVGAIFAKQQPRGFGAAEGSSPRAKPACTKSAECVAANQGKPFVCKRDTGVCAPLESEQCHVLAGEGDVANDATLWFGVMFPTTGPDAPLWGQASVNAVDLARRDFNEVSSGLPPARPGGPPRPLGLVVCDDAKNPEQAADHLVNVVGVPAIVGFARSKEVLDLATSVFIPRGVLALASNTASMLTSIPHAPGEPRLVFRTTTSATMTTEPDTAIVSQVIEPELRRTPGLLRPNEPIRVALARIDNASGLSHGDLYVSTLRYNGKSVAQNGDNFRMIVIPDDLIAPDPDKDLAVAAAEIAAYRPHVLLLAGPSADLIPAVERAWPPRERFRPRYVNAAISHPSLFQLVKERPEARRRILGVDTASGTEVIAKFVMRYNQLFTPKVTPQTGTSAPYDAVYLLAYAAVAVGEEPMTGKALARAIARMLPPGEPVDVGPAGIYPALHALSSGKNIDLKGTTTSLDFNLETGDATADFAVFCISPGGHGDTRDAVESGLVYDARAHRFEGVMRCP